jgi:hypothetical protein
MALFGCALALFFTSAGWAASEADEHVVQAFRRAYEDMRANRANPGRGARARETVAGAMRERERARTGASAGERRPSAAPASADEVPRTDIPGTLEFGSSKSRK